MNIKTSSIRRTVLCTFIGFCTTTSIIAARTAKGITKEITLCTKDTKEVPLQVKNIKNDHTVGYPSDKSPIRIPSVTMEGRTLHFVTPCTGMALRMVQDEEICYETVITSDSMEIPADLAGTYELQIVRGDYIFYAEVEL